MTLPCYFKGPVYKIQLIILQEKQCLICIEFVVSLLDTTSSLWLLLSCFLFIGWTRCAVMLMRHNFLFLPGLAYVVIYRGKTTQKKYREGHPLACNIMYSIHHFTHNIVHGDILVCSVVLVYVQWTTTTTMPSGEMMLHIAPSRPFLKENWISLLWRKVGRNEVKLIQVHLQQCGCSRWLVCAVTQRRADDGIPLCTWFYL